MFAKGGLRSCNKTSQAMPSTKYLTLLSGNNTNSSGLEPTEMEISAENSNAKLEQESKEAGLVSMSKVRAQELEELEKREQARNKALLAIEEKKAQERADKFKIDQEAARLVQKTTPQEITMETVPTTEILAEPKPIEELAKEHLKEEKKIIDDQKFPQNEAGLKGKRLYYTAYMKTSPTKNKTSKMSDI